MADGVRERVVEIVRETVIKSERDSDRVRESGRKSERDSNRGERVI